MLTPYLTNLKALLDSSCPYPVRLAHTFENMPSNTPFIIISPKSASFSYPPVTIGSSVRYPIDGVVTVSIYVPAEFPASEAPRIMLAYVMPVLTGEQVRGMGLSENGTADAGASGYHRLSADFRIKAVFSPEKEAT